MIRYIKIGSKENQTLLMNLQAKYKISKKGLLALTLAITLNPPPLLYFSIIFPRLITLKRVIDLDSF